MLSSKFYNIFVIFNSAQKYCFLSFYMFLFNLSDMSFLYSHSFTCKVFQKMIISLKLSCNIKSEIYFRIPRFFLIRYHFCYLHSQDLIYSLVYIFFFKCLIYRFFVKSTAYQGVLYILGIKCAEKIS